uniref:HLY1 n=1 Tax=Entamoeba histolytica TaxID=5759 RepID=Q24854_ENTHI|nr:HLY1 [Entamoeba histolytica]
VEFTFVKKKRELFRRFSHSILKFMICYHFIRFNLISKI